MLVSYKKLENLIKINIFHILPLSGIFSPNTLIIIITGFFFNFTHVEYVT